MRKRTAAVGLILILTVTGSAPLRAAPPESKTDEEEPQFITARPSEIESGENRLFFRVTGVGMFAASAGDLATTEWGLKQTGIYEGNPFAENRGVRVATHVVAPALVWWTTEKMNKAGHGKLALVIRIGMMVAYSYAAIHNARTVHGR